MASNGKKVEAVAYTRTSSAAHCLTQNVTGQLPADDWGGVAESDRHRHWRHQGNIRR